ncbi:MAG: FG-GAP repeat protein [Deltaproteobacteria bacterium]|nr:FG-GAP repeat protein [Deltaproteobacteria bacterium]
MRHAFVVVVTLLAGCGVRPPCSTDRDGDGALAAACGGADCDDEDASAFPGATEVCDGADNNCDGVMDRGPGTMCLQFALTGERDDSELGFRFSPPLDVDGDGAAELAVGARVSRSRPDPEAYVAAWSTVDGALVRTWRTTLKDALFGHAVVLGPDVDRDGRADVIAAAPNAEPEAGRFIPRVTAYSLSAEAPLWTREYEEHSAVGWHLSRAWDVDGDGVEDVLAGDPSGPPRRVLFLSGADGSVLRTFAEPPSAAAFGWFVHGIGDQDGDGDRDVLVGAPGADTPSALVAGAVFVVSTRSGSVLRRMDGTVADGLFGDVVAALPDLDGDGLEEVVVGAPGSGRVERPPPGRAFVFLSTGVQRFAWDARQPDDLYGRMVAHAGDVDGDGVADVAVSAPLHHDRTGAAVGRLEVRSGRTGEVILEESGTAPEGYFGWHVEAADAVGRHRRPGLVVSAHHASADGFTNNGWVGVYLVGGLR